MGLSSPISLTKLLLDSPSSSQTTSSWNLARGKPIIAVPPPITYYALDLEQRELERALDEISNPEVGKCLYGKVDIKGLRGTYDDGLKFIESRGLFTRRVAEKIIPTDPRTFCLARCHSCIRHFERFFHE